MNWRCILTIFLLSSSINYAISQTFDKNYGIHVGNDTDVSLSIEQMSKIGVKWVRLWADINWNEHKEHLPSFNRAIRYKKAGFNVILVLSSHSTDDKIPPKYREVKSFCDWIQTVPGMKESIDIWEICNELNLKKYWKYDAGIYVNEVLRAAWDSFSVQGEMVLGGSFTPWQNDKVSTEITEEYMSAGYLKYCNYAGFHPYTETVGDMLTQIRRHVALFKGKPAIITEWNLKESVCRNDNLARGILLDYLKKELDRQESIKVVCLYRLLESKKEGGWPGILHQDYSPFEPFYTLLKKWNK